MESRKRSRDDVSEVQLVLKPQQNISAFMTKLYNMVCDGSSDGLIHWNSEGTTFKVTDQEQFAQNVLPVFFKHNNFSSFVRQLNMYGFHKVPDILQGNKGSETTEVWEFQQENFQRGRVDLLPLMKRKVSAAKQAAAVASPGDGTMMSTGGSGVQAAGGAMDIGNLQNVLQEISSLKQAQGLIAQDLQALQQQNQAIWQESMHQHERHHQQEVVVDKILRFLGSVFTSDKLNSLQSSGSNANGSVQQQLMPAVDSSPMKAKKRNQLLMPNLPTSDGKFESSQQSLLTPSAEMQLNSWLTPAQGASLTELVDDHSTSLQQQAAHNDIIFGNNMLMSHERVRDLRHDLELMDEQLQNLTDTLGFDVNQYDSAPSSQTRESNLIGNGQSVNAGGSSENYSTDK